MLFLSVGEISCEGVDVLDVGRFDAVQDHVHDREDVGEGFLLLAAEWAFLEVFEVFRGEVLLCGKVFERLAQEGSPRTRRRRRRCVLRSGAGSP